MQFKLSSKNDVNLFVHSWEDRMSRAKCRVESLKLNMGELTV